MVSSIFIPILFFLFGCRSQQVISQPARESPPVMEAPRAEKPPEIPGRPAVDAPASEQREIAVGRPLPPSPEESIRIAVSKLTSGKKPVIRNGRPLALLHDLDADGIPDILLLAVGADSPEKAEFEYLSDFRRMFDPAEGDFPFSVEVFLRKGPGVSHAKSVAVGTRRVCENFSSLPFPAAGRLPYGISLIFPATDGREHVWVLFSTPARHAVFSFREKADVKAFIQDIDGNGIIDLLLFEDVFEDSTGYETYITWYRWDGTTFRKHRSANVVRNLRKFFQTAGDLLAARSWRRFLDYTLSPQEMEASRKTEVAKTLDRIFKFSPFGSTEASATDFSFSAETLRYVISDVVFPEVLENPFPLGKDGPESFPFAIRVVVEGESYFFTARLGMNRNPFGGKMFYFLPY